MRITIDVPNATKVAVDFVLALHSGCPATWRTLETDRTPKQRQKPQWNAHDPVRVAGVTVELSEQEERLCGERLRDIPRTRVTGSAD